MGAERLPMRQIREILRLFPAPGLVRERVAPDPAWVHQELRRVGVTQRREQPSLRSDSVITMPGMSDHDPGSGDHDQLYA